MGSYAPAVIPRAPCPRQQDAEARSPRERELDEPSDSVCALEPQLLLPQPPPGSGRDTTSLRAADSLRLERFPT